MERMTVNELIEKLKKIDGDLQLYISTPQGVFNIAEVAEENTDHRCRIMIRGE